MNSSILPFFPLIMVFFMLLFWDDAPMTELEIDNKIVATFEKLKVSRTNFSNYSTLIHENKKHENITIPVGTYNHHRNFKEIYTAKDEIIFYTNNEIKINIVIFKKNNIFKSFQVAGNYRIQGNVLELSNLSGDLFIVSDLKTILIDNIAEDLLTIRAWNKDVPISYSREIN